VDKQREAMMSTIAIVIFVAIGLVMLMLLTDREDSGASLAGYVVALVIRACQGSF
jgi:preprotein translocase subunit SecG